MDDNHNMHISLFMLNLNEKADRQLKWGLKSISIK